MKAPAFQFYADDFIGGTCDLSAEEVGMYIRLLCYQWGKGSVPVNDPEKLNRIAGGEVSPAVLFKFPGGVNERMDRERVKQVEYRDKCSQAGRKGGGNPAFKKGQSNPYYDKGGLSFGDKGTHKGRDKGKINSPSPSPSPSPVTIPNTNTIPSDRPSAESGGMIEDSVVRDIRHHEITSRWGGYFSSFHGMSYVFSPRDASALKRLLAQTRDGATEILDTARSAWERAKNDRFARCSKQAATLRGLCEAYNEIRVELQTDGASDRNKTSYA